MQPTRDENPFCEGANNIYDIKDNNINTFQDFFLSTLDLVNKIIFLSKDN